MIQNYRLKPLLTLSLSGMLAACSSPGGGSLFESGSNISVKSTPPGAQIWIMGKQYGVTPANVPSAALYPGVFKPADKALYGQIRFEKEGCQSKTVSAGSTRVAMRVEATLDCGPASAETPSVAGAPAPRTAPAVAGGARPAAPAAPAAPAVPASAKQRLLQIDDLHRNGLITEKEYRDLRARVLDTL